MTITRKDFTGGINLRDGIDKLGETEYPLGMNIRIRTNNVSPIKKPRQLTGINAAMFQGICGIENYLIVAADGYFYLRDMSKTDSQFSYFNDANNIPLTMDPMATVHFQPVPESLLNYSRVPQEANRANTAVNLVAVVAGSPACIVVQNGINQPLAFTLNGVGRVTGNYASWSDDSREYVPIGTFMYFNGNTLYLVSPDGKNLFRSVSGRPLDFVIVIDNDGAKKGDATESAYKFTFAAITGVGKLFGTSDFFAGTATEGYRIVINYDDLFFGEPKHNRIGLNTGMLSPYAIASIGADTVFVDAGGIKSFNAVAATASRAEVIPFSDKVQALFNGVVQTNPCAISLRDYTYFAVNTIFGEGILVYDEQLGVFVSLDTQLTNIIRFAVISNGIEQKLVVCTKSGVYIYDDADEYAEAAIYIGDFTPALVSNEIAPFRLRVQLANVYSDGTITVDNYCDGKLDKSYPLFVDSNDIVLPPLPWVPPFAVRDKINTSLVNFQYEGDLTNCYAAGFWIRFNFNAQLNALQVELKDTTDEISANSQL